MSKFIPICVVILLCSSYTLAEFSADDCWSLGLNKANLLCSTCDHLEEFGLAVMKDHCRECCQHDKSEYKVKQYARAILEVCTCKFGAYPQIQAFVKSDRPGKFPNLQIKYVRGLDPIIKLIDRDGNIQETLAIDKWNTDSVEEFLKTHLASDSEDNDFLRTNKV